MRYNHIIIPALVILFASCAKHQLDKEAEILPYTLIISSPSSGAHYRTGDSIRIEGLAIYKENIHGYDITIREVNDTTIHFFNHVHEHNDTLLLEGSWKNTLNGSRSMEAEITLYLDHDGTTGKKKAMFTIE